jgi:hypothetical protein
MRVVKVVVNGLEWEPEDFGARAESGMSCSSSHPREYTRGQRNHRDANVKLKSGCIGRGLHVLVRMAYAEKRACTEQVCLAGV